MPPALATSSPPLYPGDQALISQALTAARTGSATLSLLAQAHEAASRHNMIETVRELRKHIYDLIPPPPQKVPLFTPRMLLSSVVVGVISGSIVSWLWRR